MSTCKNVRYYYYQRITEIQHHDSEKSENSLPPSFPQPINCRFCNSDNPMI